MQRTPEFCLWTDDIIKSLRPLSPADTEAAAELLRIHRQPAELCPAQQCLRLFDEVTYAFQVVVTLSAGDIPVFFGKWKQTVTRCVFAAQILPTSTPTSVLQIVRKWLESPPELLVVLPLLASSSPPRRMKTASGFFGGACGVISNLFSPCFRMCYFLLNGV